MRLTLAAALAVPCLAGCGGGGGSQSVTGATSTSPAVYTATLSASSSCVARLPVEVAVRVYEAKLFRGGHLEWSGPTVIQPPGHQQASSARVVGDSVSLVIGIQPMDQSDEFNGLREELGGNRRLTISGSGSGHVEGSVMSGNFAGDFEYQDSNDVPVSCNAADHHFRLVPR